MTSRKHLLKQPGTGFLLYPTRFLYLQLGFMLAGNCVLVCRGDYSRQDTETTEETVEEQTKANGQGLEAARKPNINLCSSILTTL